MKKIYSVVLILLAFILPIQAANITLNVDDPSRITLEVNGEPYEGTLTAGDNSIEGCFKVTITATPGNTLVSVDWENGYYDIPVENNSATFGTFSDGAKYYVITKSASQGQSAIVKLDVDKASAVKASFEETSRMVDLVDGFNEINYDPELEKTLKIYSSVSAQMPLYSVTIVDGAGNLTKSGNVYFLDLPCSGIVNVVSQFPATECDVEFHISLGAEGVLDKVTLDNIHGEELPIVDGNITVNAGSVIYLHFNEEDYAISSYTVNGDALPFSNPQRLIVIEDIYVVEIEASKYPTYDITIDIDNPQAIEARYGSNLYPGSIFTLEAGSNTIPVNSNKNSILLTPVDTRNYVVVSVTCNGEEIEPNYLGRFQISDLMAGDKIIITTAEIERDIKAVVYVNDAEMNPWVLEAATGEIIELATGYNLIQVANEENPFRLNDGYGIPYIYVNDEMVAASGSGLSRYYQFTITEGTVVKVFVDMDSEPEFYSLSFSEGAAELANIIADQITPITRMIGYEVLQNTEIQIIPKDSKTLTVEVNGTSLSADADGTFRFNVEENSNIVIEDKTIGVKGIQSVDLSETLIFNLQGMRVTVKDLNQLPKGVYIVNGEKHLIK